MSLHDAILAKALGGNSGGSGGSGVDVTASVGQTIVVEEVDANGKPTKWKAADFQEKICGSDLAEIVPLTEFTPSYNDMLGAPTANLNDFELVAGEEYKVVFDGVEYVCEAASGVLGSFAFIAIGNNQLAGGADTGEPFGVVKVTGGEGGMVITFDMNPHSVQVFSKKVTPIPVQYVSNAFPYYVDMTGDGTSDSPYVCTTPVEEALNAAKSGRTLVLRHQMYYNGAPASVFYNTCFFVYLQTIEGAVTAGQAQFGSNSTQGRKVFNLVPQEDGTYEVDQVVLS